MAKSQVPIYRFVITLKDTTTGPTPPRTALAMSYREQDEFLCFDDTRVTVYQVRRELVEEIACDGRPVEQQEVDEPSLSDYVVPIGGRQ